MAINSGVAYRPKYAGRLCGKEFHRLAYEAGEIVKARTRETNPKKALKEHKSYVGAWCRIGGGQGALSQAREETGVACRPSKQLDYSSSSEKKAL